MLWIANHCLVLHPSVINGVSAVLNAKAFTPHHTFGLAGGGLQHAFTVALYLTGAAIADLRNHAVRLMKRHG